MNKWWLLSMLTLVLACKGSLEESSEEEAPQAEDPNTSATAPTEPPSTATATDASAPAVPNAPSLGKKDMDASVDANGAAPTPPPPQACAGGAAEKEPNETAAKASKAAVGTSCGVVGPGDTDFWSLGVAGAKTLEVDAASDDVQFSLVDAQGAVMIAIFPGDPIDFDTDAAMFVRVTSKTKQSYSIEWQ